MIYRGAVADALERYAAALTTAGFTVVSSDSIPYATPSTATDNTEATAEDAETADTAGTAGAAGTTAPAATPPATTPPTGGTSEAGGTDTTTTTEPETPETADETAATAQPSGRERQVMILERNGERIRLTVYQAYGTTTVLMART
ncbi:hypothetical protein [Deinococcus malanensis]|uniref:hypothetical protein n=1 Tax=Deinococcus malanensis TaxID=1706855 RepID=UPI001E3CB849|nr:hypothetical protein [Deinococcus malanensis]